MLTQLLKIMRLAGYLTYESGLFLWTVKGALEVKDYAGQNPEDWAKEYMKRSIELFGEIYFAQLLKQMEAPTNAKI